MEQQIQYKFLQRFDLTMANMTRIETTYILILIWQIFQVNVIMDFGNVIGKIDKEACGNDTERIANMMIFTSVINISGICVYGLALIPLLVFVIRQNQTLRDKFAEFNNNPDPHKIPDNIILTVVEQFIIIYNIMTAMNLVVCICPFIIAIDHGIYKGTPTSDMCGQANVSYTNYISYFMANMFVVYYIRAFIFVLLKILSVILIKIMLIFNVSEDNINATNNKLNPAIDRIFTKWFLSFEYGEQLSRVSSQIQPQSDLNGDVVINVSYNAAPYAAIDQHSNDSNSSTTIMTDDVVEVNDAKPPEKSPPSIECPICKECQTDCVIVPCYHACCCHGCIEKIKKYDNKCPTCRNPIQKTVRLFIS